MSCNNFYKFFWLTPNNAEKQNVTATAQENPNVEQYPQSTSVK